MSEKCNNELNYDVMPSSIGVDILSAKAMQRICEVDGKQFLDSVELPAYEYGPEGKEAREKRAELIVNIAIGRAQASEEQPKVANRPNINCGIVIRGH